jgi:hypothetical protein
MHHFPVKPKPDTAGTLRAKDGESSSACAGSIAVPSALSIPEQIELQLAQKLSTATASAAPAPADATRARHQTQVSLWLDVTQWPRYLQGHDLAQAAQLIRLPSRCHTQPAEVEEGLQLEEPQLQLILDSFDRVIERARTTLLEDKVNVFD